MSSATVIKIIATAVIIFFGIIAYACCMMAHTSDEAAERMYQEYLKWKRKKEEEWKE